MNEVKIIEGWEFRDGIWNGPFPFEGYDNSVRMCAACGEHLSECMGCCKLSDLLPAMEGKPLTRFPRELCFWCITLRCHWTEDGSLVRVDGPRHHWKEDGSLVRIDNPEGLPLE